MERCNRQKNRDLTMVAGWMLVHPGHPVTTTETYYWRTYYLPTYLPSGQGEINFRPRRRLTVSYRFSSCRRRKRVGRVPPERGESNALSETPHAAINSLAATVHPPMNVGYVWNYSNSLVHFCSALLGPENHLSSRSSFFLLFFSFYPLFFRYRFSSEL
jgi:hypothetical protein